MEKSKKIKITLGIFYLIVVSCFLYFLFSQFSFEDISSIKIIQSNTDRLNELKSNNLIYLFLLFFFFTVFWVFLLGFGSPVVLIGGFIFGKWVGTILVAVSLSVGALALYLMGKYFLYNFLKDNLLNKFKKFDRMFKKNHFSIMIIFRFVGFVPFSIANLLPVIFNINAKNYFFGTLVGIMPSVFIISSLGSGLSSALYKFETFPSVFSLLILPEIYSPLIGFIVIDMDENDGMTGLKLASLTTVAMFIVVAVTGINFANPIFVSIVVVLISILLLSELYSMFNQISRGARRKKAIAGVIIFSMSLLASISSVDVSAEQGINDWDTAIFFAFSMYLDIINIILYFLEAMGS